MMLALRRPTLLTTTLSLWAVSSLAWAFVGGVDAKDLDDETDVPDVPDFWPSVSNDLRKVSWAHAVNSHAALKEALDGNVMMLEADVSLNASQGPIMAHPPADQSDLSLRQFLDAVIAVSPAHKKKGIKLDFKSIEAFEASTAVLKEKAMSFPVWLNADIVAGPGGTARPVDPAKFLTQCAELFPSRTVSIGWTTGAGADTAYTSTDIDAMEAALGAVTLAVLQPITFPIRAGAASRSHDQLLELLQKHPNSTFTIWGSKGDEVDEVSLVKLATFAGFDRVYIDLPEPISGLTPPNEGSDGGSAVHGPLPPALTAGAAALAAAATAAVLRL